MAHAASNLEEIALRHSQRVASDVSAPETRVAAFDVPLDTIETIELTPATFDDFKRDILIVERQRYGGDMASADNQRRRLQLPLRDRVSNAIVGYVTATGPAWLRDAVVLARVENYLRSGCSTWRID
jgi:hypothetical protein